MTDGCVAGLGAWPRALLAWRPRTTFASAELAMSASQHAESECAAYSPSATCSVDQPALVGMPSGRSSVPVLRPQPPDDTAAALRADRTRLRSVGASACGCAGTWLLVASLTPCCAFCEPAVACSTFDSPIRRCCCCAVSGVLTTVQGAKSSSSWQRLPCASRGANATPCRRTAVVKQHRRKRLRALARCGALRHWIVGVSRCNM